MFLLLVYNFLCVREMKNQNNKHVLLKTGKYLNKTTGERQGRVQCNDRPS